MAGHHYTPATARIPALFAKIREVGVPSKIDQRWLASVGFGSSTDQKLIPILKFVGMIDAASIPTERWRGYRVQRGRHLAHGIRAGYAELFRHLPNAHVASVKKLTDYFGSSSDTGQVSIARTVTTFRSLVALADFTGADTGSENVQQPSYDFDGASNSVSHHHPSKPYRL
jgi:hypothetical protein